jgi:hypothetical protein
MKTPQVPAMAGMTPLGLPEPSRISLGNLDTRRGRQMIEWIAMNDDSGSHDEVQTISEYITVTMLSHIYSVDRMAIARKVRQIRDNEGL